MHECPAVLRNGVIDKLSSKKINYAVVVSYALIKQPNNMKIVKKLGEFTSERKLM